MRNEMRARAGEILQTENGTLIANITLLRQLDMGRVKQKKKMERACTGERFEY